MAEIFDQMDIKGSEDQRQQVVYSGGPVSLDRGFILHRTSDPQWESSLKISDELTLTASKDIILAMAGDEAPFPTLMLLGYAGWGPGQLEQEIQQNSWLTTPATPELVFDAPFADRLRLAVEAAGVNFGLLSGGAGRA
jgi:putative transcriptional regulator